MKNLSWSPILFAFILIISPAKILSQDRLERFIQLPPQELTVEQYLYHIEDMTDLNLVYSTAIIENRRIAIYSDSILLRELLDTLFPGNRINFLLRDRSLVLSPQKNIHDFKTHFTVTGKVNNKRNGKSVPFATIYVPNESTGTIANFEGSFELQLPTGTGIDSLKVSCLGYRQSLVSVNDLLIGTQIIELEPQKFQIDEIIIRPLDPHSLIRASLDAKKNNYPTDPAMFSGFFRESSMQDDKYIGLSEAIINIFKHGYTNDQNDLIRLVKGRRGSNIENSDLVNLVVEGGLYNNVQLDIVKYGISFLDPEFFGNYEYEVTKQININHRQTYLIKFTFLNNIPVAGFNGTIYLDAESLALVRAEFSINEESLGHAYDLLIKKTPPGFRIQPKYARYEVEYRHYEQKWNLSHVRSELALRVHKKRGKQHKGYNCTLSSASEFVITGKAKDTNEKIRYRDAAKPGDILYEQIAETDAGFWGTENIILPEEPLLKTIEKLKLESLEVDSQYVNIDN